MSLRKTLSLLFPTTCTVCLAVSFASARQWVGVGAALLILLAWLPVHRGQSSWQPTAAMIFSVGLAGIGLLAGASPFMLIFSATLALAGWDLILLDHSLAGSASTQTVDRLEMNHYTSLALALGSGLLITIAGRFIHFQVPFGVMLLLVIFALLSLGSLWRMFVR